MTTKKNTSKKSNGAKTSKSPSRELSTSQILQQGKALFSTKTKRKYALVIGHRRALAWFVCLQRTDSIPARELLTGESFNVSADDLLIDFGANMRGGAEYGDLYDLAESIIHQGLLQPIGVIKIKKGTKKSEVLSRQLHENLMRENIHPARKMSAVLEMRDLLKSEAGSNPSPRAYSKTKVASACGLSSQYVGNLIGIAEGCHPAIIQIWLNEADGILPARLRTDFLRGIMSRSHGEQLQSVVDQFGEGILGDDKDTIQQYRSHIAAQNNNNDGSDSEPGTGGSSRAPRQPDGPRVNKRAMLLEIAKRAEAAKRQGVATKMFTDLLIWYFDPNNNDPEPMALRKARSWSLRQDAEIPTVDAAGQKE